MELRESVSAHLSNAVVAAIIFTLYNTYTGDTADPVTVGIEFVSYVIALFIGFAVITPLLNKVLGSVTT